MKKKTRATTRKKPRVPLIPVDVSEDDGPPKMRRCRADGVLGGALEFLPGPHASRTAHRAAREARQAWAAIREAYGIGEKPKAERK